MRVATEMRKEKANEKGLDVGIRWPYTPVNSLSNVHKKYPFNSEAKRTEFVLLLFANDTTIFGINQEIVMGKEIIEEVMGKLKSRQVKRRECYLWGFREWQCKNTRTLVRTWKRHKNEIAKSM